MLVRLSNHMLKGQSGFTLIEMIVVVGIIAVLAAVIVPNISKFLGSSEQGAMNVERHNVEEAFAIMMAETQVFSFTPHDASNSSTATSSWDLLPTGPGTQPLVGYLVNASTVYYYCFSGDGIVSEQFETATACTLP